MAVGNRAAACPVEVAYWDTPGRARGVTVANGYVYLADDQWGLVVFPEYPSPSFSDLPSTHWAFREIEACFCAGIVSGYDDGLYRPDTQVTRDQMAVYIARALAG